MKNVISVDSALDWLVDKVTAGDGEPLLKDELTYVEQTKSNLHSLLISKLPEKRLDAVKQGEMIPFDGNHKVEMDWLRKCQDAGFNEALEDVKAVLDELFRSGNE